MAALLTVLVRAGIRPAAAALHLHQAQRWMHGTHQPSINWATNSASRSLTTFTRCCVLARSRGLLLVRGVIGDGAKSGVLRSVDRVASGAEAPGRARGTASAAHAWAGSNIRGVVGPLSGGGLEKKVGGESVGSAIRAYARCYWELSKPRLSMLVVSTAGLGFVMGSGEVVEWAGLGWTCVGTMMAACSANAFNQVMEISNDSRMKRTMRRPLPSGRIGLAHAAAFAATIGIAGVTLLALKTNELTAELGAGNLLLYTLVYTPLKQIHWVNTWVGAVVGAIPPLMGWTAVTGRVDAGGWILAGLLYFWQIPHFMALAYLCRHDYAAGRYKMLSLGDISGHRTALAALRNCVYLLPLGFVAQGLDLTSGYFGLEMLLLGTCFGGTALSFYHSPTSIAARKLFRASLLYLSIFMAAMIYQRTPNPKMGTSELSSDLVDENGEMGFHEQELHTNLKGVQKNLRPTLSHWPVRPPIASLSAAPFPFLPAPEDRNPQHC